MIKKILIANRGEIACRVIKTAKKLNIATVAVYSEADKDSLFVKLADESYFIGGSQPAESYLDMNKIIAVAKKSKADAIHPGYGFLSENATFVKKLNNSKIKFIGPNPNAIKKMGDKIESKNLAIKLKLNVIPGHTAPVKNSKEALKISNKIGYPVLLKASAGGGGKGMRIVRKNSELEENFNAAKSELEVALKEARDRIELAGAVPSEPIDFTAPGRRLRVGKLHPLTQVTEDIVKSFRKLGFVVADGPEVEDEYHCFDALNTPVDHPARDAQDTFYVAKSLDDEA